MTNNKPLLSLCLPTNGVIEWVVPVLESIFAEKQDESLYEIVLTDNGDNKEFAARMEEICAEHKNIRYIHTTASGFLNEVAAYELAKGVFVKFVNHRTVLLPGALSFLLDFVRKNQKERPFVYFSNGEVGGPGTNYPCKNFDEFVATLGVWGSWSTGMAFWREDISFPKGIEDYNELFPHTNILYQCPKRPSYLVDGTPLFRELPQGKRPKGKYDVFFAFLVEFPSIVLDLCRKGLVSVATVNETKKQCLRFSAMLYLDYVMLHHYCSYDLSNAKDSASVYFSFRKLKRAARRLFAKRAFERVFRKRKKDN